MSTTLRSGLITFLTLTGGLSLVGCSGLGLGDKNEHATGALSTADDDAADDKPAGSGDAKADPAPAEKKPAAPTNSACKTITVGDGTTCKDNAALKSEAYAACTGDGIGVTSKSFDACDDTTSRAVKIECCSIPEKAPAPTDCTKHTSADASCQAKDALKTEAASVCSGEGRALTAVELGAACDAGFEGLSFTCCK